jgi:hypothetical protein
MPVRSNCLLGGRHNALFPATVELVDTCSNLQKKLVDLNGA